MNITSIYELVRKIYLEDDSPFLVGFSGGKDSTATLQVMWYALKELPKELLHKEVRVISSNTLVENPIVEKWQRDSLTAIARAAQKQGLPIIVKRLTPELKDTYWVNVIGKGYAVPRRTFRWCTSRLKIKASNQYIKELISQSGTAVLALGTRKAESAARATSMAKHAKGRLRDCLSPNAELPGSWIFSPIEEWSNNEVWSYLSRYPNPWDCSNEKLLDMYAEATEDNECPFAIETNSPSCGKSRFGCWVCSLIREDLSLTAMVKNGEAWLKPMLAFRNEIASLDDRHKRDFQRSNGKLTYFKERLVHGAYIRNWREHYLRRLLEVQEEVRSLAPADYKDITLITDEELREIRRIWVEDWHYWDDKLPDIYEHATGRKYPFIDCLNKVSFGSAEWNLLQQACQENGQDQRFAEMLARILNVAAQKYRGEKKQEENNLFPDYEKEQCPEGIITELERYWPNEVEALSYAQLNLEEKGMSLKKKAVKQEQITLFNYACERNVDSARTNICC